MEDPGLKLVLIGGGTGSFTLLSALKHYIHNITALVNMADDGGSTGQLRDELGVLPPGDVRQCLVALSRSSETMRDLFNYRFPEGSLAGHSFGNLFLTAVEKMTDSFGEAVGLASEVLNITGKVVPITMDKVTLVVEHTDKSVMRGESIIDHADFGEYRRPIVRLEPAAKISKAARVALAEADIIVIAPGDLYSSIGPALAVEGVGSALAASRAKKVYVCNLVTKPGQTDNFEVHDFAEEIERLMGNMNKLDYVIYNNSKPDEALLRRYAHEHEYWVGFSPKKLLEAHYEAVGGDFVSHNIWKNQSEGSDPLALSRSYIRHEADRVARALMKIYFS